MHQRQKDVNRKREGKREEKVGKSSICLTGVPEERTENGADMIF